MPASARIRSIRPSPAATRRFAGSSPSRSTTSRWPQKSAITSGVPPSPRADEVEAAAGVEHELRQRAVVRVAGLVQLRPAVVVAAVRVGAALEQERDEVAAGHPQQVVAVRAARGDEVGMEVEQLLEPRAVAGLDGAVGEHERRGRLAPVAQRRDALDERLPARLSVPGGEIAAGLVDRDAADARDPGGAVLVVADIRVERLLVLGRRGHRPHATQRPRLSGRVASGRVRGQSPDTS